MPKTACQLLVMLMSKQVVFMVLVTALTSSAARAPALSGP
jgi:hypothetical protein